MAVTTPGKHLETAESCGLKGVQNSWGRVNARSAILVSCSPAKEGEPQKWVEHPLPRGWLEDGLSTNQEGKHGS